MSLGEAFGAIQALHGGSILKATRIVTESAGFFPDSFAPAAIESSIEQEGVFYITFLAGPAIFPSGEMYSGNWFRTKIAVQKQVGYQYVTLQHVPLRRTMQQIAPGSPPEAQYAERLDGARLSLSPVLAAPEDGSQLLVARIRYEPGMNAPEVEDVRDIWRFFWTPSEIIDPTEVIDDILQNETFVYTCGMRCNLQATVPFRIFNDEEHLLYLLSFRQSSIAHAYNARILFGDYVLNGWEARPFKLDRGSTPARELTAIHVPTGIKARFGIRKMDMYREIHTAWGGIKTDWVPGDVNVEPHLDIDKRSSSYHTLGSYKLISQRSLPHGFAKLWIRDEAVGPEVLSKPCDVEAPIVKDAESYSIVPINPARGVVNLTCKYVGPDMVVRGGATESISIGPAAELPSRPIIINICGDLGALWRNDNAGGPATDDGDGDGMGADWWKKGGRIWFHGLATKPNTPPTLIFRTPGPADGRTMTIKRAVFVNYQNSGYAGAADVTGELFIRVKGDSSSAVKLIDVGSNGSAAFPSTDVFMEDANVNISVTPDTEYELCVQIDNSSAYPHMQVRGYLTLYLQEEHHE